MSILLVLVAHNGKTLQLDVYAGTRVDAVQAALVPITGVTIEDQILMCNGTRLDPLKQLAAYKLPVADPTHAEDLPLFLYHKAFLRPGAAPPAAEPQDALPLAEVTVPRLPPVPLRHPLADAPSPLVRALPDCEASFQTHLLEARATWEASQTRMHKCRQLLSEQEVQARAADAARANVESHFTYICNVYTDFCDRYVEQHGAHAALLAQFDELAAALATIPLPPQLQGGTWRVLGDVAPQARLGAWRDACARGHEAFAGKVLELEGLFQLLRGEVEALFLQVPSVDLDALGAQLVAMEGRLDEQSSIVQVLAKDLSTVRELVEATVAQLGGGGASGSGSSTPSSSCLVGSASMAASRFSGVKVTDALNAVDTMHDHHIRELLPRVRACDGDIKEHLLRVAAAKGLLAGDVCGQLQRIALQQSRIRDMRSKLAAFNEVLVRQEAAVGQLRAVVRLPAAYRFALTECLRRHAWLEMYSAQAVRLAEHMGRIRTKEAAKREAFLRQVERYLPQELLGRAGLLTEPPHCTVSVPSSEQQLLAVSLADIQALPPAIEKAAADLAASQQVGGGAAGAAAAAGRGGGAGGGGRAGPGGGVGAAGAGVGGLLVGSSSAASQLPFVAGTGASALLQSRMAPPGGARGGAGGSSGGGGMANEPSIILGGTESMAAGSPSPASGFGASRASVVQPRSSSGGGGRAGAAGADSVMTTAGVSVMTTAGAMGGMEGGAAAGGLEMENARLRAELAAQLALQCVRELSDEAPAPSAAQPPAPPAAAAPSAGAGAAGPGALPAALQQRIPTIQERLQQQQQQPTGAAGSSSTTAASEAGSPAGTTSSESAAAPGAAGSSRIGVGSAAAPLLPPGLSPADRAAVLRLAPVKAALAAKEVVVQQLQVQLSSALAAAASYEGRIAQLETALAAHYTVQQQPPQQEQQEGPGTAGQQQPQQQQEETGPAAAAAAVQQQLLQEAAASGSSSSGGGGSGGKVPAAAAAVGGAVAGAVSATPLSTSQDTTQAVAPEQQHPVCADTPVAGALQESGSGGGLPAQGSAEAEPAAGGEAGGAQPSGAAAAAGGQEASGVQPPQGAAGSAGAGAGVDTPEQEVHLQPVPGGEQQSEGGGTVQEGGQPQQQEDVAPLPVPTAASTALAAPEVAAGGGLGAQEGQVAPEAGELAPASPTTAAAPTPPADSNNAGDAGSSSDRGSAVVDGAEHAPASSGGSSSTATLGEAGSTATPAAPVPAPPAAAPAPAAGGRQAEAGPTSPHSDASSGSGGSGSRAYQLLSTSMHFLGWGGGTSPPKQANPLPQQVLVTHPASPRQGSPTGTQGAAATGSPRAGPAPAVAAAGGSGSDGQASEEGEVPGAAGSGTTPAAEGAAAATAAVGQGGSGGTSSEDGQAGGPAGAAAGGSGA